jgi:hypothetical protein
MASFGTGYKQTLFFGNETRYGSAAVIDTAPGLVQSVTPTETNNLIKVRTMGGTRDYANIVPGKFEVSGSFDYLLQTGDFLRFAFGEESGTTATTDAGPKIHTGASYRHCMGSYAPLGVNSFPSFTLEFNDFENTAATADPANANLKRMFTGCRVNNLSIAGTVDEPVKVSCDWIAQGVTVSTAASATVTAPTVDPFVFYQGWVYATSGAITGNTSIASTSRLAQVNSFDFSINNNLEPTWYISGTTSTLETLRGLKGLIPKGRDYDGNLKLHFKNREMYRRFLGSATANVSQGTLTDYYVVIDFARIGSPTSTPKTITDNWMRLVMKSKFDTNAINGSPEDIVSQDLGLAISRAVCYFVDATSRYN